MVVGVVAHRAIQHVDRTLDLPSAAAVAAVAVAVATATAAATAAANDDLSAIAYGETVVRGAVDELRGGRGHDEQDGVLAREKAEQQQRCQVKEITFLVFLRRSRIGRRRLQWTCWLVDARAAAE